MRSETCVDGRWFLLCLVLILGGQNGQTDDSAGHGIRGVDASLQSRSVSEAASLDSVSLLRLVGQALPSENIDEPSPTPVPDVPPTAEADSDGANRGNERAYLQQGSIVNVAVALPVSYTALGAIVAAYDWMPEAFAVVDCESHWNPEAVSWDGSSYGLFQVNAIHFWRWPNAWSEWMLPEVNTEWAWELYQEQGWGIWSCS